MSERCLSVCLSVCDSVSIASTDADTPAVDASELSPSHAVLSSSSVAVVKPCVSTSSVSVSGVSVSLLLTSDSHDDSVDRAWREHVNEVLSVTGVETRAVRTFHLFPRLFYVSYYFTQTNRFISCKSQWLDWYNRYNIGVGISRRVGG